MRWYNEPATWRAQGDRITVKTDHGTDFWRKTHYGFIRDNGHFHYEDWSGDFQCDVKVSGRYVALYDQAGLMVRFGEDTWMKCGIELVDGVQQASAVVTRDFSDWSVVPLPANPETLWLRVVRQGGSIEVFYSLDGSRYALLRVAYLSEAEGVQVGPMCASPQGDGFEVTFEGFRVQARPA